MIKDIKTTQDYLLDKRVCILQPENGYRVGIDAVFLAAAVPLKTKQTVLDVGCGVGSVGLCLLARMPDLKVKGLEVQALYTDLAKENAKANGVEKQFKVVEGDIFAKLGAKLKHNDFDHVVTNPPFYEDKSSPASPVEAKRLAHHGTAFKLADWLKQAGKYVKPKGLLSFIYPATFIAEAIRSVPKGFGGVVIQPIQSKTEQAAKRVIVQAIKSSKAQSSIRPAIIVHDKTGQYTEQAEKILRQACSIAQIYD